MSDSLAMKQVENKFVSSYETCGFWSLRNWEGVTGILMSLW